MDKAQSLEALIASFPHLDDKDCASAREKALPIQTWYAGSPAQGCGDRRRAGYAEGSPERAGLSPMAKKERRTTGSDNALRELLCRLADGAGLGAAEDEIRRAFEEDLRLSQPCEVKDGATDVRVSAAVRDVEDVVLPEGCTAGRMAVAIRAAEQGTADDAPHALAVDNYVGDSDGVLPRSTIFRIGKAGLSDGDHGWGAGAGVAGDPDRTVGMAGQTPLASEKPPASPPGSVGRAHLIALLHRRRTFASVQSGGADNGDASLLDLLDSFDAEDFDGDFRLGEESQPAPEEERHSVLGRRDQSSLREQHGRPGAHDDPAEHGSSNLGDRQEVMELPAEGDAAGRWPPFESTPAVLRDHAAP